MAMVHCVPSVRSQFHSISLMPVGQLRSLIMCNITRKEERLHKVFVDDWNETLVAMAIKSSHRLILVKNFS